MMRTIKPKGAAQSFTAVGAPSIIMIFVILCLTCFAALSLVSANAEISRRATRGRYLFFCSSVPKSSNGCGTPID
jgi:hypothetical protein